MGYKSILLPLLVLYAEPATAALFGGVGRVIDGDSLMVGEQEVRLFGIDAPELTQTCNREGNAWECGAMAADQLSKLVAGKQVSCASLGKDKHGRALARCSVGATDVNRSMVVAGYALAFRRYSMDYISAEESAKVWKRGIWAGSFVFPSEVRSGRDDHELEVPLLEQQASSRKSAPRPGSKSPASGACRIKGNHSRKGEWIYHLPGMPYYAQTRAEQMFCTEAEARAAGYRRSRADQHR